MSLTELLRQCGKHILNSDKVYSDINGPGRLKTDRSGSISLRSRTNVQRNEAGVLGSA